MPTINRLGAHLSPICFCLFAHDLRLLHLILARWQFVRAGLTWERDIILERIKSLAADHQPWRYGVEALGGAAAGGRPRPLIERLAVSGKPIRSTEANDMAC